MNIFLTLVMNDIGIAKNHNKHNTLWNKLYLVLALICGFIIYTDLLINVKITPNFIGIFPVILLYSSFPMALKLIKREWKENTVGWWLQLPYSRKILLGAKLTAGAIRYLRIVLVTFLISVMLLAEGMILQPNIWNQYSVVGTFVKLSKMYMLISFSPLLIVFGMLIVILKKTRFRPAAPLFWVMFGGLMSIFSTTFFNTAFNAGSGVALFFTFPGLRTGSTFVLGIIAALIIAYLIFLLSVLLLEKYVEV